MVPKDRILGLGLLAHRRSGLLCLKLAPQWLVHQPPIDPPSKMVLVESYGVRIVGRVVPTTSY